MRELHITPAMLERTYELLRVTPPFNWKAWKLPEADAVEFIITRDRKAVGDHATYVRTREHIIGVSSLCVGRLDHLITVVAHEMIHAVQRERGTTTANTEHNADFWRRAKIVCHHHGFSLRRF